MPRVVGDRDGLADKTGKACGEVVRVAWFGVSVGFGHHDHGVPCEVSGVLVAVAQFFQQQSGGLGGLAVR